MSEKTETMIVVGMLLSWLALFMWDAIDIFWRETIAVAILLGISTAIWIFERRICGQIDEDGIEARGVISRVVEVQGDEGIADIKVYARYRTEDGDEIEGLLLNQPPPYAPRAFTPGDCVRLKYHPKLRKKAKLIDFERK